MFNNLLDKFALGVVVYSACIPLSSWSSTLQNDLCAYMAVCDWSRPILAFNCIIVTEKLAVRQG